VIGQTGLIQYLCVTISVICWWSNSELTILW